MGWFNYTGLAVMAVIMIPNIIYAVKCRDGFENRQQNKALEIAEQIGRYACFALMVFNIPYTYFNFWFKGAFWVYLAVDGILSLAYLIFWAVFRGKGGLARAVALSVTPSVIFLFSGVMLLNIPLTVFAVVFAVCHIRISVMNS
ncbi:MAG: hypothetical protein NC033_06550 [Clostridiales bacterium]|nr:hypothetical protein [Clostridiales bacterium]